MVGGWRNGSTVALDEEALEAMVLEMLEKAVGGRGRVHFRRCVRHPQAIPLYLVGHGQRLAAIEERLARLPGIYLTGNAFRGVALNDCTREALRVARTIEKDCIDGQV